VEKNCGLRIELYPEMSKDNSSPIASFIIRILSYGGNSKILTQSGDLSSMQRVFDLIR
jgi:hypothetical protein